jgi:predicted aminopeptidase
MLLALAVLVSTAGCYYLQAAQGQWQVLRKRQPIDEVIRDAATPRQLAERLRLVQAARQFSIDELQLPDNESYRTFADIEREFVVWNVFASPEFSLQAKRWCFPVAGCVSYRGYFSEQAARRESARLAAKGFDVFVGGVSAYSTLGNFDDPVLSTMMHWDDLRLVAVLFHELAHQVLYIKGDTSFNESFASAVEEFGMRRWLSARRQAPDIERYDDRRALREDLMAIVTGARFDLEKLYAAPGDDAARRLRKRQRLERLRTELDARLVLAGLPDSNWPGDELNNARIVSLSLYEGRLPAFRNLFRRCNEEIACFYARVKEIAGLDKQRRDAALDALATGEL